MTPPRWSALLASFCLACVAWSAPEAKPSQAAQEGASIQSVDALLAEGRALLLDGQAAAAQVLFERAGELEADSPRTRLWLVRAWMDQGRSNASLDAIDAFGEDELTDAERDYLYGMAFLRRAEGYVASGVTDSAVQINFVDANERLARAVAAEPERFSDAFLPLAKAAWFVQDLPAARDAAERAVTVLTDHAPAWHQLGHVALSQFVTEEKANAGSQAANEHWRRSCEAFSRAIAYFGRPLELPAEQRLLADAATQLGHARMWKRENASAAQAYAVAMSWAPERVDYRTIYGLLTRPSAATPEEASTAHFERALEDGARGFREVFGAEDARDATLLWWLGWSRFAAARHAAAEEAFLECLAKTPDLVNAWFYIALARLEDARFDGAVEALERAWELDPAVVVSEAQTELELNAARLARLVDHTFTAGDWEHSALVAQVLAEARQTAPDPWNNLGLFLCKRIDELRGGEPAELRAARLNLGRPLPELDVEVRAQVDELAERALVAYRRALELAPDDPGLLNDTAVVLHHYLERDLEEARGMYRRAVQLAQAELAPGGLDPARRSFLESVLTDARANLDELAPASPDSE